MPSGGGGGKEKIKSEPWSAQQPYLENLFSRAENLYQKGPTPYYPGDTHANMSPVSQRALQGITQRGQMGSPLNKASGQYLQDVLGGKYLNADAPGLDSVLNRARSAADSTYAGMGRYGSGAHDTAVADSVGNIVFQNYNNRLGDMMNAAQLAPMVAGQDFVDLNAMLGAGDRYQQQLQGEINADMAKYNYQQQAPYNNLQAFQDFIQGNYGGTQTQPSQQPSFLQSLFGTGLAAAGTAGNLGWAPFA